MLLVTFVRFLMLVDLVEITRLLSFVRFVMLLRLVKLVRR